MNRVKLVVGDWSLDGHEKTEIFLCESNKTQQEVKDAYKVGSEKVGFDLSREVCREYEENFIDEEYINKLRLLGFNHELHIRDLDLRKFWINIDDFVEMYLFICHLGDPSLQIKVISDDVPNINIGGYGLFS